ncbi:hypothetical protein PAGU2595_008040 [Lysobacter xanthus]
MLAAGILALLVGFGAWLHGQRAAIVAATEAPAASVPARVEPSRAHRLREAESNRNAQSDDWNDAAQRAVEQHARRLAASPDPRQRVLGLRILLGGSTDRVARRKAQAIAAALLAESPDDEVLALAQTWFCDDAGIPCTDAQREAWAKAAPDNAAAYLGLLDAHRDDPVAVDALLKRAADGDRYDAQTETLQLETIAAFDGLVLPPLSPTHRAALRTMGFGGDDASVRRMLVQGSVFTLPLPPLGSVTRLCVPPISATRARDCRTVLLRMVGARSLVEHNVAVAMLERLTRGTPEGLHWQAEKRDIRWRMLKFAGVRTDARYWDDFQRLGEVGAIARALQRAGIPLHAPPGWAPPYG